MTTQAEFFQTHAVDGVLDDKLMAQMLNLPEGDSGIEPPQRGTPDPTPAPAPAPVEPPEPTPEPTPAPAPTPETVILAKDGVHTIGYEKLVEAREAEKAAKARAEVLEAEIATLKSAAPTPPAATPAPTAAPAPAEVDFGDFSDEAVKKGILEAVEKRVAEALPAKVAEALAPLQKQQQEAALTTHFKTLYDAHPTMDAMLESKELESWITSQPSFAQTAIRAVLAEGTAPQVVEVFDSFVKATGKTAAPPPTPAPTAPPVDPTKAAQAAIDAAADKPPTSLTEIPGSTAQHDEAATLREMSPMALLKRFEGKTPEQIEALMAKAL
jgi:hypothetical protein